MVASKRAPRFTIADGVDGAKNFTEADIPSLLQACGVQLPAAPILVNDFSQPEPWPVVSMNRADFLAKRIDACAKLYFSSHQAIGARMPTHSVAVKDFEAIEKTTWRLWTQLKLRPKQKATDLPAHPLYTLRQAAARHRQITGESFDFVDEVYEVVKAISTLNRWAHDAAGLHRARITKTRDRNSGDEPRRILTAHLMNAWFDVFQTIPQNGYDKAKAQPTTPFLKFCIWIFSMLGIAGSPEAIHVLIKRVSKSPRWEWQLIQDKSP